MIVFLLLIVFIQSPVSGDTRSFTPGDRVKVQWLGQWHICTVKQTGAGEYLIHFEDDDRIFDRWMPAEQVYNYTYKLGDIILVEKDGQWVSGKVIAAGTLQYKIHYIGIESAEDEWVGPDRIKDLSFSKGEKVRVFWKGDWFDAVIINYENGLYLVHYDGFPASCDEWVTIDRIKTPYSL